MPFFTSPRSFHSANSMATSFSAFQVPTVPGIASQPARNQAQLSYTSATPLPPHSSHPTLPHLTMLVFGAVLEVVCVSLPGYIIARQGMFTADMQKFAANLNVTIFTPCLSMLHFPAAQSRSKCCYSLHQACLSIDNRQACGPCHHPPHFCIPNPHLIHLFHRRSESIWVFEETSQLCGCYGGKSATCSDTPIC